MRELLIAAAKLPFRVVRGIGREVLNALWPGRRNTEEPVHAPAPGMSWTDTAGEQAEAAPSSPPPDAETITMPSHDVREKLERGDPVVLIDVRESHERDAGFIPGSVHIPVAQLRTRFMELDPGHTIVAYCASGRRSLDAAHILREMGVPRAWSMAGGMARWVRDGGEVVRPGEAPRRVTPPDLKGQ